MTELRTLKVALLGCGNVGAQVARILLMTPTPSPRAPAPAWSSSASPCATSTPSATWTAAELFTTDAETLVKDADLVIELMGGIEPACSLILTAMRNGACVVTGNKALLAQDGPTSTKRRTRPASAVLRSRRGRPSPSCAPSATACPATGSPACWASSTAPPTSSWTRWIPPAQFADALAEAQRLGYAEADPTADVEGHDAAAKAAILASLSFHTRFALENVHCEGITRQRRRHRRGQGRRIRHQAAGHRRKLTDADGNEGVSVRVHPTLLPREHPLAAVRGAFNAVFIEAENAGELMFYGQGAGGTPTASAVLGDLVSAARRIVPADPAALRPPPATSRRCPSTPSPATTSASTPTSPVCWPGSPSSSPSMASPSKSCGRPSTAMPTPTWNRPNSGS